MARNDSKEQPHKDEDHATKRSGETHSGTPNPNDPQNSRSTEHKSGYGGDGGEPRTSSNEGKE